jgi:hypothetical protein
VTTLLAVAVIAALAVACATLLVDLRRMRRARPSAPLWRGVGVAQIVTGLLWLLYGDLALHDGAARGWFAIAIGALFVLQGMRRVR